MLKKASVASCLFLVVTGTVVTISPAVRARFAERYNALTGWDEETRRADPVGFAKYAEKKLREDLKAMQKTRRDLASEVGQITRKIREQEALGGHAQALAEDFRSEYQLAGSGGDFPVEVRGAAYTADQVRTQVSMLLAEAKGYEQSLAELQEVQQQAEAQMENLAVKVEATEAQLAGLATKRELIRARQLTVEGEQLLAKVDELLTGNAQLIAGNPVRTVRELVQTETGSQRTPSRRVTRRHVEEFLNVGYLSKRKPKPQRVVLRREQDSYEDLIQQAASSQSVPIQTQSHIPTSTAEILAKPEVGEKK